MAANNIYIQVDLNSQAAQQNVNALNQAIAQTGPVADKTSKTATAGLERVSVQVNQTTKAFGELTQALVGLGLARMAQSLIQVGSEIGRAETMLTHFIGSADLAADVIEQIAAVAKQSTFANFKDLLKVGQQLAVFKLNAQDIPAILKIITDQVTAMGGSMEDVGAIAGLFGKIMNKEFVGAGDILKALPKQGVQAIEALRKALSEKLKQPVSVDDIRTYLKEGVLKPQETIYAILGAMQKATGGAAALVNDAAKALKNLGDAVDRLKEKVTAQKAFGEAFAKLGSQIEAIMGVLAAFVQWLSDLPEWMKEAIVTVAALGAAVGTLTVGFKLLNGLLGPATKLIWQFGKTILVDVLPGMVALAPEILAVAAALGLMALATEAIAPGKLKEWTDTFTKWATSTSIWDKVKGTVTDLAKKSGLFGDAQIPGLGKPGADEDTTAERLTKIKEQVDEWSRTAGQTMLQALGSPADAIALKYQELFVKLEKLLHDNLIVGAEADAFRRQLTAAQQLEADAKIFEKQKQYITERAKLDEDRIKGSYEAQIAYVEAFDEQDTRKKVASIDKVTGLRIKSAEDVARTQENLLNAVFERERKLIELHPELFKDAAASAAAVEEKKKELADATANIEYKRIDDTNKYRLEGWKKANDAIIEDQKRIYDSFKSEFDEIFDAFTQKDVGKAMGEVFKKLALGEAKNLFSSSLASSATELAGYGKPDEPITKGGGILSQLFKRGMAPRAPTAPPAEYVPKGIGPSEITFPPVAEASKLMQPATLFISGVDAFNKATDDFLLAVQQFAAAGGAQSGGGGAGGVLGGIIPPPPLATGYAGSVRSTAGIGGGYVSGSGRYGNVFQAAAQATGLPEQLIRAVSTAESGGNVRAISPKGAMGLMQLMPATAKGLGVTDPNDPYQNVMAGAEYLKSLVTKYGGDTTAALRAYNMGPAGYDRAVATGRALPVETQNYVGRVATALKKIGGGDLSDIGTPGGGGGAAMFGALPFGLGSAGAMAMSIAPMGMLMQDTGGMGGGVGGVGAGGWPAAAGIGLGGAVGAAEWPAAVGIGLGGEGGGGTAPGVAGTGEMFGAAAWARSAPMLGLDALTVGAMPQLAQDAKQTSVFSKLLGLAGLGGGGGTGGKAGAGGGLTSLLSGIFGKKPGTGGGTLSTGGGLASIGLPAPAPPSMAGLSALQKAQISFGIGQSPTGGTSVSSVLGSSGVGTIAGIGGGLLLGSGLAHHTTVPTVAGGALLGLKMGKQFGLGPFESLGAGAGLGLVASGVQRGGAVGALEDVGGGALAGASIGFQFGGPAGAAVGAVVGAVAGAVTGVVRLFIKTEQEKIRAQVKQIYGVDISNRQILTQIQQIVDQKYGGNVQVGVHSQDVQDLVRLYALSSGQTAGLPRQMYNAAIAQSTQGLQLQPTYNGGVQVQNPYTGTTSYQYAHAAITAQGANPSPGSGLGVPGAAGLINNQFQQLTLQTIQGNPSAIAMASSAAATAGDSRLSTAAAMQEPLTALS